MKSLKIPFNYSGGKTDTTSSPTSIAAQKITDVLVTSRFERVMRHRYGAGLRTMVFEVNDPLSMADFNIDAKQLMADSISRVSILDIKVSPTTSVAAYGAPETTLGVTVIYKLPLGSPQIITINVVSALSLTEDSLI
jgi:phage baseplate assembly protein W